MCYFTGLLESGYWIRQDISASVGAVAIPDGRVIICGGLTMDFDDRYEAVKSIDQTYCWEWKYQTNEVTEMRLYNKLPFRWLGPLTPKLMQLVHFKYNEGEDPDNTENVNVTEFRDNFSIRPKDMDLTKEVSTFHRIIIVPWPAYSLDAYKAERQPDENKKEAAMRNATGDLIEGQIRITKSGSRIFWKRHQLDDIPLGFGGCYVAQNIGKGMMEWAT